MQLPGNGSEPATTSLAAIGGSDVQFTRARTIGGVRVVHRHTPRSRILSPSATIPFTSSLRVVRFSRLLN